MAAAAAAAAPAPYTGGDGPNDTLPGPAVDFTPTGYTVESIFAELDSVRPVLALTHAGKRHEGPDTTVFPRTGVTFAGGCSTIL